MASVSVSAVAPEVVALHRTAIGGARQPCSRGSVGWPRVAVGAAGPWFASFCVFRIHYSSAMIGADILRQLSNKLQYAALRRMAPSYGFRVHGPFPNEAATHVIDLLDDDRRYLVFHTNQRTVTMRMEELDADRSRNPDPIATEMMDGINSRIRDPAYMKTWRTSPLERLKMACQTILFIKQNPEFQRVNKLKRCNLIASSEIRRQVWDTAPTAEGFNSNVFRLDVTGSLVCRMHNFSGTHDPQYDALRARHLPLSYDYEHLISRSHGGPTKPENLCVLNAGYNRFKSDAHLFLCGIPAIFECVNKFHVNPGTVYNLFLERDGAKKVKDKYQLDLVWGSDGLLDIGDPVAKYFILPIKDAEEDSSVTDSGELEHEPKIPTFRMSPRAINKPIGKESRRTMKGLARRELTGMDFVLKEVNRIAAMAAPTKVPTAKASRRAIKRAAENIATNAAAKDATKESRRAMKKAAIRDNAAMDPAAKNAAKESRKTMKGAAMREDAAVDPVAKDTNIRVAAAMDAAAKVAAARDAAAKEVSNKVAAAKDAAAKDAATKVAAAKETDTRVASATGAAVKETAPKESQTAKEAATEETTAAIKEAAVKEFAGNEMKEVEVKQTTSKGAAEETAVQEADRGVAGMDAAVKEPTIKQGRRESKEAAMKEPRVIDATVTEADMREAADIDAVAKDVASKDFRMSN